MHVDICMVAAYPIVCFACRNVQVNDALAKSAPTKRWVGCAADCGWEGAGCVRVCACVCVCVCVCVCAHACTSYQQGAVHDWNALFWPPTRQQVCFHQRLLTSNMHSSNKQRQTKEQCSYSHK